MTNRELAFSNAEHRVARRANALVVLDQGWSCERVAEALLLDDDAVRARHRASERGGIEALKTFDHDGGGSRVSGEQEIALADWVDANCPRSIRKVGAWLKRTFGLSYSRSEREIITFLRYEAPRNWRRFCDPITDNFRVIHRADFRVIA